ncbi:MAG: pitrilysin family protein [Planctomycetota bacterium]
MTITAEPTIHHRTLDNGLAVVVEPMPSVQSAAVRVLLPGGLTAEKPDQAGSAGLLAEMLLRGTDGRSARAVSDALDDLGAERATSATTHHLAVDGSCVADNLDALLGELLAIARWPDLEPTPFEGAKLLAEQAIEGLADEPQRRALIELRARHLPDPLGRSDLGKLEAVRAMTPDDLRALHDRVALPGGAIVAVAGNVDPAAVVDRVAELTADWSGEAAPIAAPAGEPSGYSHVEAKTTQVHIAGASHAVPERDESAAMLQKVAVAVLSGGMSGRLFTEVREKRGLCYSVFATYAGLADRGAVFSYAGTTTARAQETLDVLAGELRRLAEGVSADEFERAVVGLKARLVMQGESTSARADALARDVFVHGRPRPLTALAEQVDAVTLDALNQFVKTSAPSSMTWVTIGPEPLTPPSA